MESFTYYFDVKFLQSDFTSYYSENILDKHDNKSQIIKKKTKNNKKNKKYYCKKSSLKNK